MITSIIEAIVLGLVQGFTEFIPVSSSGHLLLVGEVLNFDQSSFVFELALNIGTLLALVIYFWGDLTELARKITHPEESALVKKLFISTVPAVLIGAAALGYIEAYLRSPYIAVITLIVVGIAMIYIDKTDGKKVIENLSIKDAWVIGFAQVLAFVPGVSRSGITIIAGRSLKLSNEQAARYSFLMAIPVVTAATLRLGLEPKFVQLVSQEFLTVFVGVMASFLSGLIAIRFMLKFLRNNGLKWFGIYRIIFAGVVLLLLFNN